MYGMPLTEVYDENGRPVQYFERNRFEYHPEQAGTPYEVQLGLLGRDLYSRWGCGRSVISNPRSARCSIRR